MRRSESTKLLLYQVTQKIDENRQFSVWTFHLGGSFGTPKRSPQLESFLARRWNVIQNCDFRVFLVGNPTWWKWKVGKWIRNRWNMIKYGEIAVFWNQTCLLTIFEAQNCQLMITQQENTRGPSKGRTGLPEAVLWRKGPLAHLGMSQNLWLSSLKTRFSWVNIHFYHWF